jgi:hypothetical protein
MVIRRKALRLVLILVLVRKILIVRVFYNDAEVLLELDSEELGIEE